MYNRKNRGISTIIAAIFMVVLVILGLNAMRWGMQLQNNMGQTVAERANFAKDRSQENLELRNVGIVNNKFNITLYDTGSLPVHLVRLWVTNNTAGTGNWQQQYDLNIYKIYINPREAVTNIGQSLALTAKTLTTYTLSFITERGTIATYKIAGGSDAKLNVRMYVSPTVTQTNNEVDLQMIVTNNNTLADAVTNVMPNLNVSVLSGGTATQVTGPSPSMEPSLMKGSSTSFRWTYNLQGSDQQLFSFTGSVMNGMSNSDTVSVKIKALTFDQTNFAQSAGTLTINYNTMQWAQGSTWQTGWVIPQNTPTVFKFDITNHNSTFDFYLSKNTALVFYPAGTSSSATFYLVNSVTLGNPPTVTAYCPGSGDYCTFIPRGQTLPLYFGAAPSSGTTVQKTPAQAGLNSAPILIFGKLSNSGSSGGIQYGQDIPFMGIQTF